jgi:spore maturation protein CgeB
MKRLLIIGSSAPERIEEFYAKAFERLGVGVTLFDLEGGFKKLLKNRFTARLSGPLQAHIVHRRLLPHFHKPTFDAVFVVKGYQLSADTIHACRRLASSLPWVILNPDSPFEPGRGASSPHIRESIPLFDQYFIWSRALVPRLLEAGAQRPAYLPFAYDQDTHWPAPTSDVAESLSRTISFVGTYDPQRAELLETIADLPLQVFGEGWDRLPARSRLRTRVNHGLATGASLRKIVTSSLLCLNILRPQNYGAHNMRTFEVPAMRGLMLTYRSEEQQNFFPEHQASLMYGSTQELRDRVKHTLADSAAARSMRELAHQRSVGHSYLERARQVLAHLKAIS